MHLNVSGWELVLTGSFWLILFFCVYCLKLEANDINQKASAYLNVVDGSENNLYSKWISENTHTTFLFMSTHLKPLCYFRISLQSRDKKRFLSGGVFPVRRTQVNNGSNSKVNGQGRRQRKCMISQWVGRVKLSIKVTMHTAPHWHHFISLSKQWRGFKFPN